MGSITLTKAKGIWKALPAPLRGAATLLAVLALAALLTTVRHNASAYQMCIRDRSSTVPSTSSPRPKRIKSKSCVI